MYDDIDANMRKTSRDRLAIRYCKNVFLRWLFLFLSFFGRANRGKINHNIVKEIFYRMKYLKCWRVK